MIFGTWRSYFISWQIFENKVWCPVSKKIRRYFHFLLSLTYLIERLDSGIVQCNIVPSFVSSVGESWDWGLYFAPQLPRGFDHFYGVGRGGEPPPSPQRGEGSPRGGASIPDRYITMLCYDFLWGKQNFTMANRDCWSLTFPLTLFEDPVGNMLYKSFCMLHSS